MTCPIIDWLRLKWAVRDNQSWVSRFFFVFFCFSPSPINIAFRTSQTQPICILPLKNTTLINGVGLSLQEIWSAGKHWLNTFTDVFRLLHFKTLVQLLYYVLFLSRKRVQRHFMKSFHTHASGTRMIFILKFPCYVSRDKYLWHPG